MLDSHGTGRRRSHALATVLVAIIRDAVCRYRTRRTLVHLQHLDARLLADIGLSRGDLNAAMRNGTLPPGEGR